MWFTTLRINYIGSYGSRKNSLRQFVISIRASVSVCVYPLEGVDCIRFKYDNAAEFCNNFAMAHGVGEAVSDSGNTMKISQNNNHCLQQQQQQQASSQGSRKNVGVMGSRRIFAAAFKLKVLDSYRNDIDCRGNQRATARKYGIHRRQIQKWLQCEDNLRSSCAESNATTTVTSSGCCTVPVGSNNSSNSNVAASPVSSMDGQGEKITKSDLTSLSSSASSSPGSSINSNSNSPIASIGVATCAGTAIATTSAPAAAVAPALNLSLARLHGDEQHQQQLAARQGLPPHLPSGTSGVAAVPIRHSERRGSSPTSPQYIHHYHNQHHPQVPSSSSPASSARGMLVGYTDYANHQETHQHHQLDRLIQDPSHSSERKYSYVMNCRGSSYDSNEVLSGTGSPRSSNSDQYYQSLESYNNSAGFVGLINNNNNVSVKEIGLGGAPSPSYRDKRSIVEPAGNPCEPPQLQPQSTSFGSSSPLLVLHATTIKSERASPDSLATPGPCSNPGSPESAASLPRPRIHHQQQFNQQQQQSLVRRLDDASPDTCNANRIDVCDTNTNKNFVNGTTVAAASAAAIAAGSAAVHLNETTRPLAHVHVSVDSHAFNIRDSEKQQREREKQHHQQNHHHQQQQQQQQEQQLHRDSVKLEYEDRMRSRVKEEVVEREEVETTTSSTTGNATPTMSMITMMSREAKREISEEETIGEGSRYHRERTTADAIAACPDYRGAPEQAGTTGSGPVSPVIRDSVGSYSGLSSPRAASSSGISTSSSCSDSEIDPLDYSSASARNAINDLSRRRSFSLRFKLDVLDAFHGDVAVAGNQRATARKFGINRRQVQKWLGQESELRGEIALRGGDLRQRLGPISETNSSESSIAVDLRTSSITNCPVSGLRSEAELEHSSPPLYCCDVGSSSQRLGYYHHGNVSESSEMPPKPCTFSCCIDGQNAASMICHQESASRRRSSTGYPESQGSLYCYSPRDPLENAATNEGIDVTMSSSPLKRFACTLTYCYETVPSPKRVCLESIEEPRGSPAPPQDVPLCLVKPKRNSDDSSMQIEPVTSTVPTPPAQLLVPPAPAPVSKKDAILFKPYLDNPVSKPTEDTRLSPHPNNRGLSPLSAQSVIVNNNNNCHGICNLNEERSIVPNTQHDYALELSLRVPVSWRTTHHGGYSEFPERLKSAFVRYPTSPHYT